MKAGPSEESWFTSLAHILHSLPKHRYTDPARLDHSMRATVVRKRYAHMTIRSDKLHGQGYSDIKTSLDHTMHAFIVTVTHQMPTHVVRFLTIFPNTRNTRNAKRGLVRRSSSIRTQQRVAGRGIIAGENKCRCSLPMRSFGKRARGPTLQALRRAFRSLRNGARNSEDMGAPSKKGVKVLLLPFSGEGGRRFRTKPP